MKYFKQSEFTCKCGCGKNEMMTTTLDKLDKAREIANIPFHINSGYRCIAHNEAVGGKSEGAHTSGYAVDIECTTSPARWSIIDSLIKVGFNRIGVAKTFIHVDDDPSKPANVIWEY